MLLYSLKGKFRHRDRMLALAQLRGDENVLDIGTGRGLLLVGAAKRLTTGRAVGLDIWKTSDLSDNARAETEAMLAARGRSWPLPAAGAAGTGYGAARHELRCHSVQPVPAQHLKARRTGPSVQRDCAAVATWRRGDHL